MAVAFPAEQTVGGGPAQPEVLGGLQQQQHQLAVGGGDDVVVARPVQDAYQLLQRGRVRYTRIILQTLNLKICLY